MSALNEPRCGGSCDRLFGHAGPHMTADEATKKYAPGIHLVCAAPVDPIRDMAKRLGCFEGSWPTLRTMALQARNGLTDIERQLAASILVDLVLKADGLLKETE